ncbi:putative 2-nonaprenyl-3-methyl-6-methoxy-1,4-benzoquinol hydroxylase [Rhodoferax antarcticus ANT.BR]|uniref:3-demethoxyubiquinol 3-hydroxylase n=2 Tax=Rhodoferax antarcticus TaxID=81479 RepID=A0A1Q8YK59_9BURK|nr:putative 2-nonaprenyl-3-methyl-6-methoxy-1,4-benzoquinol hydroxylase [Rhodoferax antarcticus ANT.BR]
MPMTLTPFDRFLSTVDDALRTVFSSPPASQPCPTLPAEPTELSATEKKEAGALMRVNHVGEVCAQALYTAQAFTTDSETLRAHFLAARAEETDHLAWTAQRVKELGGHTSLLNPLWYAGAFGIGLVAGKMGDAVSLGFVVETENQVEAHLETHMNRLPVGDHASRAIVAQMMDDEARHAYNAMELGAMDLPASVKGVMKAVARVMTTVAHRV